MRSLLLALGLAVGFTQVAVAKDYTEIRFGTESAYAPFEYKKSGRRTGQSRPTSHTTHHTVP